MSVALSRAPAWLQDKGYSARDDRQVIAAIGSGIISGYTVAPGSGMSVVVQPGIAIIPGTRNIGQGSYLQRSDTAVTVPWPAAGGSQRVDLLYLQVKDNTEIVAAGGSAGPNETTVMDVAQQGSALPADAVVLATVTIPAGASSILAGNIVRPAPVTQPYLASLPTQPYDGQVIHYNPGTNILWHLRWLQAQGAWFFLGGSSIFIRSETGSSPTNSWTQIGGTIITIPRPGTYRCRWGGEAIGGPGRYYSLGVAGLGTAVTDYFPPVVQFSGTQQLNLSSMRDFAFNAAGQASLYHQTDVAGAAAQRFWLEALPVFIT